jgi:hypothetical protein
VLILVAPAEFSGQALHLTWYLAAWDFHTGTFERISRGGEGMRAIDVASSLVRDGSP